MSPLFRYGAYGINSSHVSHMITVHDYYIVFDTCISGSPGVWWYQAGNGAGTAGLSNGRYAMVRTVNEALVAPCGMNCAICSGYLAYRQDVRSQGIRMTYCTGCRPRDKRCAFLKRRCEALLAGEVTYCYECGSFPCEPLEHLDKRYRTLYRMSMIQNLQYVKKRGIDAFLQKELDKWRCPECGGTICCHNGVCFKCDLDTLRARKTLHRWDTEIRT